jgi:hypothetical protein
VGPGDACTWRPADHAYLHFSLNVIWHTIRLIGAAVLHSAGTIVWATMVRLLTSFREVHAARMGKRW